MFYKGVRDDTKTRGVGTRISAWVRQAQADEIGGAKPDAPLTTAQRQDVYTLIYANQAIYLCAHCADI